MAFLFLLLLGVSLGQFQQFRDNEIHRVLKAKGFYDGDVNARWSKKSDEAFSKLAVQEGYSAETGHGDTRHHHFQRIFADWFLDNDVAAIKPKTLGVFFLTFNKASCGGRMHVESCRYPKHGAVLDDLFRTPKKNTAWDYAVGTRGIVRFETSERFVHHVALDDHRHTKDIKPVVKAELDFDPAEKYDFQVYVLPSNYLGLEAFAAGSGEAGGRASYFLMPGRHVFDHELGHNLGLNHCGVERRGSYNEYGGFSSSQSNRGYSFNALDLEWLRVIHRNILELKESRDAVSIKSLTSVSEGYSFGDTYTPISGFVAAAYQTPAGARYTLEWREMKRQDWWLDRDKYNALLIHHKRDTQWRTVLDAVVPVGGTWTSPYGDLTVVHTGPQPGTFSVRIGTVTTPAPPNVNFFSWSAYWDRIKAQKVEEVERSRARRQRPRVQRHELTNAQMNDNEFLLRLHEMCQTHADSRCAEAKGLLEMRGLLPS